MDKFPIGAVMNRSLTIKTGQCHVHRYLRPLLERIENGDIDPSFVVTHRMSLDDAPDGLRDVQEQAGRVREGRPEAMTAGGRSAPARSTAFRDVGHSSRPNRTPVRLRLLGCLLQRVNIRRRVAPQPAANDRPPAPRARRVTPSGRWKGYDTNASQNPGRRLRYMRHRDVHFHRSRPVPDDHPSAARHAGSSALRATCTRAAKRQLIDRRMHLARKLGHLRGDPLSRSERRAKRDALHSFSLVELRASTRACRA